MKQILKTNALILLSFFILNCLFLLLETQVSESTGELLYILLGFVFFVLIIIINMNTFPHFKTKIARMATRASIVAIMVFLCWSVAFCFNWYVYYNLFGILY